MSKRLIEEPRKKHLTFQQYYYKITISAEIAQLVEHFTRNEGVEGSSPFFSFKNPENVVFWIFKFLRFIEPNDLLCC